MERLKLTTASTALTLFFLTVATRIPFTSKFLYHMDSVHFALALERYDVTVHQPHPPGYFLYVMLGRLVHLFIEDANRVFLLMSIVFSGLAVAALFLLALEMYDRGTALIASFLAISSPNLWFHGEIALSYAAEAFLSTLVGLFCWKVYTGKQGALWLAVVLLGIAGGVRQNSVVFLLPLLLVAARKMPLWKVAAALLLLGAVCCAWFFPMLYLTGGFAAYTGAFSELWEFSTGHHSVFERGWEAFSFFARTLYDFTAYSAGASLLVLGLAAYAHLRHGSPLPIGSARFIFLAAWCLPAVIFHLLIFIHPSNPGYALIFTPPLLILGARATVQMGKELLKLTGKERTVLLTALLLSVNTGIFLFSPFPVSWRTIVQRDASLAAMVAELRCFDPAITAFFVTPDVFLGFRQVMYYLPHYRVYQVDLAGGPYGGKRNIFWGMGRTTYVSKVLDLPPGIRTFAAVLPTEQSDLVGRKGVVIGSTFAQVMLASGPIELLPNGILSRTARRMPVNTAATGPGADFALSNP
jgi:hypothetical protein